MKVDAHVHLWNPARGDYGWMPPDQPLLNRPYRAADLEPALRARGIDQVVLVQAAPTIAETEYMLGIADTVPWIGGVVGWIDFEARDDRRALERLARHPKFKGVRPMIQDIPDPDWMLRDDIQWAFDALVDLDLTFDALGFPRHLANFHKLLTARPRLRTVIDHAAKPQIRDRAYDGWAADLRRIAQDTGALCKLSGLATEASAGWTSADLKPYAAHVLAMFGPGRVMFGSDWPVVRLAGGYAAWWDAAQTMVEPDLHPAVFGETAARFYRLKT
jgi:L-fuconolactonase